MRRYVAVSSANNRTLDLICSGRSFLYVSENRALCDTRGNRNRAGVGAIGHY